MTLYGTPLLYLNMGGEMLYVLRQRLKAQQISVDKTVQVLDDIITALLDPKLLSSVFEVAPLVGLSSLRSTLETVILSSIMKLDKNSMNKLFDLMITMVKYQLTAATGPREVVLLTLTHTDAMRDMVTNSNAQEAVGLVHQMMIDFYGSLTCDEIWNARRQCLQLLEPYCVRVSILLRLRLQNDDCTFNVTSSKYDEKYEENYDSLGGVRLCDLAPKSCVGSFNLFGDRVTQLGRNIYSPVYGMPTQLNNRRSNQNFLQDCGTKAELGMLAAQLGTEEHTYQRPFTLNLFSNDDNESTMEREECTRNNRNDDVRDMKINEEYKSQLHSVCADFLGSGQEVEGYSMDLLDMLDKVE